MARVGLCLVLLVGLAAADQIVPKKIPQKQKELNHKFKDLDKQAKSVSWHQPEIKIPEHILKQNANATHVHKPKVSASQCGKKISASALGLKRGDAASKLFRNPELLQVKTQLRGPHPGRSSLAKPGVGIDQVLKDEGTSDNGKVSNREVYVTVLKDGMSEVGCYQDAMLEFGDKYGNGKFKFGKMAGNVSIARYSELILKDEQLPMTPTVCYQFCRTVWGMVFFGIANGKDCYCTPYYKPMPGDNKQCDQPCEGEPSSFCGNMKGKSTIWEMHLCDDTGAELQKAEQDSKDAVDFYFENALLSSSLGKMMSSAAEKLETAAGVSGSTTAADMARVANKASKPLTQAYQKGAKTYAVVLDAYKDAVSMADADFTDSSMVSKADFAVKTIKDNIGEVKSAAKDMHSLNQLAYPLADAETFGDAPSKADSMAMMLAKLKADPNAFANINFRDVAYSMGETTEEPKTSSCSGPTIGSPMMGLGFKGCAAACEAVVSPINCLAFALYGVGTDDKDMCILLEDITAVETFSCEDAPGAQGGAAAGKCMVKMSAIATGYKPKASFKQFPRCFGSDKDYKLGKESSKIKLSSAKQVKVGSGKPLVKPPVAF